MNSLTRAAVEDALVRRCGTILTKVGLDGTTRDGTNADLNDPIRRGLQWLGLSTTTDPLLVVDADLAPVAGWPLEKLLDVAELRTLETVWNSWTEVRTKTTLAEVELQQLADRLLKRIDFLTDRLRQPYGPNTGIPVTGHIGKGRHIPSDQNVQPPPGGLYGFGERPPWGGQGYYYP